MAHGAEPEDPDHLALAGKRLDSGDEAGAIPHLTAHVAAHPDAVIIRVLLADLHFKRGDLDPAKAHYARYVRDAAGVPGTASSRLLHSHTRLMEIATTQEDAFAEQLHRGVGLVLLVRQWDADATPGAPELDELTETTLVRAAASLKVAREVDPTDPRVPLYLAEVWERLGRYSAARTALAATKELLPDATLNADERARLRRTE